jgi:peptide/nickel transport system permease protein
MTAADTQLIAVPKTTVLGTAAFTIRTRFPWVSAVSYAVIGIYVLVAVFGPLFLPYDPVATEVGERLLPPGSQTAAGTAVLGTDGVGRDVLAQIVYGARTSLFIGSVVVLITGVVGVALGAVAGFFGGWTDVGVSRVIDILMAFPGILLALVISGLLERGVHVVIIALCVAGWVGFARLSRSIAITVREREWVEAARLMGIGRMATIGRHILPFVLGSVVALASIELAGAILAEAALSFLGLGLPSSVPSWGQTISAGKEYLGSAWWISVFPGLALTLLVVAIGLVGDDLTRRFTQIRD